MARVEYDDVRKRPVLLYPEGAVLLNDTGAEGVGLFRTELQFMIGETMPRLADQSAFYKKILDYSVVYMSLLF